MTHSFRYDTSGNWYKGNTHIHSTASDGGQDFGQIAALYAGGGYDFLFRTDHWVASDQAADVGEKAPLMWIDGIELDGSDDQGSYYHIVCLGKVEGFSREMGLLPACQAAREQGGLLILAHPFWCGNSFDEALRVPVDGVEIYNHVCRWLNGKGDSAPYWHAMLARDPNVLGFAADDAHLWEGSEVWNAGWIVVNAAELSRDAVLAAIRAGNYYSSCGPEIHDMSFHDGRVSVSTSPVRFIRCVGPGAEGGRAGAFDAEPITEATFKIPEHWPYAVLELEDTANRRAWTNSLLI
jgi:predicted metal-dependent phosphoesterase TrpH